MLLGHTAFAEQAFQDARLDAIHNIEFAETGFGMTFTLGTEVATGGANVSPTTAGVATFSIGDETAFGEAFQNLITFNTGEPDFFIWIKQMTLKHQLGKMWNQGQLIRR